MKQKTRDIISDGISNIIGVGLFVAACLVVVWLMLPLNYNPTELTEETGMTLETLNFIEQHIDNLEELNRINEELIQIYELQLLECAGDLHSS